MGGLHLKENIGNAETLANVILISRRDTKIVLILPQRNFASIDQSFIASPCKTALKVP